MKQLYKQLDWDTEFFNFVVGRISGQIESRQDIQNIEQLINEHNSRLTYYSSFEKLPDDLIVSNQINFLLVDKKTTFTKSINPELEIHKSVSSFDKNNFSEKLIDLAIQSGIYSRYNVDKLIGKEKFEEMYRLWMTNSISRKIAKEVLVFKENNQIGGFVTLGEKNNKADIGIIAVDGFMRGKGIGKILMTSAEKWFSNAGYKSIQVVTQGDNLPACKLYESLGYHIETVEYFYHIWKK